MSKNTDATLIQICPDCVNRVNGDPAPEPDGWQFARFRAEYDAIDTTSARYVELIDSTTGGCELCMEAPDDGLREVRATKRRRA